MNINLVLAGGIKVVLKDFLISAIINDPLPKRTLKVRPFTIHDSSRELQHSKVRDSTYCTLSRGRVFLGCLDLSKVKSISSVDIERDMCQSDGWKLRFDGRDKL